MAKINFFACAPAILLITLMVVCSIPIIGTSDAKTVTKFDGNISSKVIDFKTRGDDASLSFTVPKDVPVTSTYLNVSTADQGTGNFPDQPGIDVGVDGDWEWKFQGSGYGTFGKQTLFSDNNTKYTHTFTGAGTQTGAKIRLPKDATVSSAEMGINGRLNVNLPTERQISSYYYAYGPAVDDINGDGYQDLASTSFYNYAVYWWKSSGGSVPTFTQYTLDTSLYYTGDVDTGDLTADGYTDIVAAGGKYYTNYDSVVLYKNSGGVNPTWTRSVIDKTIGGSDVLMADINNDGYPDVVASSYYNGMFWFMSSGGTSPTWTKKTIESMSYPYMEQVDVADVDKDGDLDVTAASQSTLYLWLNNNNGASWTKVQVDTGFQYGFDVQFADIDRDSDQDLVASSYYSKTLKWYENVDKTTTPGSGDGKSWKAYIITNSFVYAHGFDICDIANDGYMDIICTGYYGNYMYWFEAPDDPKAGTWTQFTVDSYLYYGWDCKIKDITGDGKPDVVATSYYGGGLVWYDLSFSYPNNPSIKLGNTGSNDWSLAGQCKGIYNTGNVTAKIQGIIDTQTPVTDKYGNKYVEFPIAVTLGSGGRLTLEKMDVRYNITVPVTINGHNTDLKKDVNDLVPDWGTGNQKINLNVHSDSPGSIRISGLYIEYNAFPILDSNIINYHVNEDSVTENLFDVRDHFSDDYDLADDLSYEVHMSTADQSNVRVTLVNNYFLKVQTQKKDWNGVVSVMISATDQGELGQGITGKRTISSNSFSIIVDPVNDPPTTSTAILQNVIMNEGQSYATVSLDSGPYFTDLESDKLYYACAVDPASAYTGEDLDAYIDGYNRVVLKANGNFYGSKVPVRVYCNDRNDLSDTSALPFTDFTASVTQLMDDGPVWGSIETIVMEEDTDLPQAVKLTDFLQAGDTAVSKLTLMILFNVNGSSIFADIDNQGYLNLYASETNYDGTTSIAIRATDGYNFADTMLNVAVNPANDAPTARINEPLDGAKVTVGDRIRITGSAFDPEAIQKVEIAVGNQENWAPASGTNSWGYNWEVDPTAYTIGSSVTINVRVYDGQAYSEIYTTNVTIIEGGAGPTSDDRDGDGVPNDKDAFPDNPYETKDTDKDGWGDNSDAFPTDPKKHTNTPDIPEPGTNDGTGPAKEEEGTTSWFNLWLVVLVLVALEIALLVFFSIKKVTSKKGPSTKKKLKKKAESK